jgi:hypothetical protein
MVSVARLRARPDCSTVVPITDLEKAAIFFPVFVTSEMEVAGMISMMRKKVPSTPRSK